jgi:hypothetical protein
MAWTAASRMTPAPTRINWIVIARGPGQPESGQRGIEKSSQHKTNSGPVPVWMILRLKPLLINPLSGEIIDVQPG